MKALLLVLLLLAVQDSGFGRRKGKKSSAPQQYRVWHTVTLTFDGPRTSEKAEPNPFLDFRLDVTFSKGPRSIVVPGFYAADGKAANSGASAGGKWRVHFSPDEEGEWSYRASFKTGQDVAIGSGGTPTAFDGAKGTFKVGPTDKKGRDHRAKGRVRYVGKRYLQFAGTGEYFIKGGADSPENFLGYAEFDQTPGPTSMKGSRGESKPKLHYYKPHARDWKSGDPTWRGGRGRSIIGALNYLASKGMNSVYFLTMNVNGDGKDVWPWTSPDERLRFDCSKLDQWDIVFSHMDRKGIMLHVVTQENENDQLLDRGALGRQRKLYYRELIARFSHHLAITWNLGEENTNTDAQRKAFCDYIKAVDPYDNPIVCHTFPGQYDRIYPPLLNHPTFDGPSLQMGRIQQVHSETVKWVRKSASSKRAWFVSLDEIGPPGRGVQADSLDPAHDAVRKQALWGNLMGGGAGVEWYFGFSTPDNDLGCENWRSRSNMWDQTRVALEFFQQHLPFAEMEPADDLVSNGWCLAKQGEVYAVYLPDGGSTDVTLAEGSYTVGWYDPRRGGSLRKGRGVQGGTASLRAPDSGNDWVALIRKK